MMKFVETIWLTRYPMTIEIIYDRVSQLLSCELENDIIQC